MSYKMQIEITQIIDQSKLKRLSLEFVFSDCAKQSEKRKGFKKRR
jgi:hypothetical protein